MNLAKLTEARVLVVGDQIIDRWIYGRVDRVSPEAPVPVVKVEREEEMPGGASNVAANLRALGCDVILLGMREYPPIKVRIIGNGQQIGRYDIEDTTPISEMREGEIFHAVHTLKPEEKPGALVLSDYGKGVVTRNLCNALIGWAERNKIPVVVDPKGKDWSKYQGCTVITPNEAEWEAYRPNSGCCARAVLLTRGAKGMILSEMYKDRIMIPAHATGVVDTVGAGDTVVAALSAALAAGFDLPAAARISNAAAGVVVQKRGTATCSLAELEAALIGHCRSGLWS
jgi:D-beta-D-heptose 7-phosphate kinase/D-beta-D-heptose 1-phosphate adenosyltransferase